MGKPLIKAAWCVTSGGFDADSCASAGIFAPLPSGASGIHKVKLRVDKVKAPAKNPDDYPHLCPRCGGRAFIGLSSIDCMEDCEP